MSAAHARNVALGGCAVLALAVVLTPWYALDDYLPNGWDATWWARGALVAALAAAVALRFRRRREAIALLALAVACVAFRAIVTPDFGFAFDGLTVSVSRQAGCWVALGSSLLALLASARLAWGRQAAPPPPAPESAAAAP